MKLNLNFLIYLDLSYQYRVNYTKRTTEIQHDRGMFLVIPLVMMMMMMILRMRVVTYFDKAHFYLVRCWFIIGLVPGCRSVLCMRDTRRTKRENVNKLPLFINDELFHTSDLLTRNIEPKSKIWRKVTVTQISSFSGSYLLAFLSMAQFDHLLFHGIWYTANDFSEWLTPQTYILTDTIILYNVE